MKRFRWPLALLVLGCTGERSADPRSLGPSVAACPAPVVDQTGWVTIRTTDNGLTARAPSAFLKDGRNNRWVTDARAPDARWFGLGRITPSPFDEFEREAGLTPVFGWVPAGDTAARMIDLEYVSAHSACREAIGGVAALVESGLLSGGVAGLVDQRAVFVVWYQGSTPVAVMSGRVRDAAGQAELLAIARTVRFGAE